MGMLASAANCSTEITLSGVLSYQHPEDQLKSGRLQCRNTCTVIAILRASIVHGSCYPRPQAYFYIKVTLISANHGAFSSISAHIFYHEKPPKISRNAKKTSRYIAYRDIYKISRISRYIAAALDIYMSSSTSFLRLVCSYTWLNL